MRRNLHRNLFTPLSASPLIEHVKAVVADVTYPTTSRPSGSDVNVTIDSKSVITINQEHNGCKTDFSPKEPSPCEPH
jgi:hypothetical protein